MLVLSRKKTQGIKLAFGDVIVEVNVLQVKGNCVKLGIEAPNDVHIIRAELDVIEPVTEAETNLAIQKAAQQLEAAGVNVMGHEGTPDEPAA